MRSRRFLRRREQRLIASLLLALVLFAFGYTITDEGVLQRIPTQVPPGTYRVLEIEDGDTITVDMNGTPERVRFIGVDTPETHDPRKPVQCFGQAATQFTRSLIDSSAVRLESDAINTNRDRYNRLLRYVYLPDGRLVQAELLRQGYAFAYTSFPFTKSDEFITLQRLAREEGLGLWNACQPEQNEYGGYTSNPE